MSSDETASPEDSWLRAQREELKAYLAGEGVAHAGIDPDPAWYEPEVIAIWSIRSGTVPGTRGWWAINGDVPTDYIPADEAPDARTAVSCIAARWQAAADQMAQGIEPDQFVIGSPEDWPELAPMLRSRADTLAEWVADPELWA